MELVCNDQKNTSLQVRIATFASAPLFVHLFTLFTNREHVDFVNSVLEHLATIQAPAPHQGAALTK